LISLIRGWDNTGIANDPALWAEVLRCLKPGGHLVAFSGTRTYHRMACAIEDAGFEIRDQVGFCFGSGFPKSHSVSKDIDKAAGARGHDGHQFNTVGNDAPSNGRSKFRSDHPDYVKPSGITLAAQEWQGWGTALKPAWEPICLARKPLSEKTVAANVLKWGTGALNIGACRVGTDENLNGGAYAKDPTQRDQMWGADAGNSWKRGDAGEYVQPSGRWPANIILSVPEDEYELKPFTSTEQKRELYRWLSENA